MTNGGAGRTRISYKAKCKMKNQEKDFSVTVRLAMTGGLDSRLRGNDNGGRGKDNGGARRKDRKWLNIRPDSDK
jgi:hypothetical protein